MITFITEFSVLVSGILVYKLAASLFGNMGFSEYALSRRAVSFIQPALLLGLGVGIPRYIAYSANDKIKSDSYFLAGFLVLLVASAAFFILFNLNSKTVSFLIFGSNGYAFLVYPISLMLFGLVLHALTYSYFRGHMMMIKANILQIINMGVIPLIVFYISDTVSALLYYTGMLWIIVSCIFLFLVFRKIRVSFSKLFERTEELFIYGIQRVPGDFGLAGLLSLPAFFTSHIGSVKEAGYVSFGVSLLNMIGAAFAPIGIILLPKASQLIASKSWDILERYTKNILKISVFLTASGVILFEVFAKDILALYLGKELSDIVFIVRILIISAVGYNIYIATRSIIDAIYVKAINTRNIILSLSLFVVVTSVALIFFKSPTAVILSFNGAMFFLSALTLYEIKTKTHNIKFG